MFKCFAKYHKVRNIKNFLSLKINHQQDLLTEFIMIKGFKGIILLQLILLLYLANSQYEIYKFASTQMDFSACTAVSGDNGDIFIGGTRIQRYDKQGNLIQMSLMHSGLVVKIFWTSSYLISVGNDGQVIKWNNRQLKYIEQMNAPSGVYNADIRFDDQKRRIILNYGIQINEYLLEGSFSLCYTYKIDRNLLFTDVAYSNANNGPYIWAVTQGFRFRFTMEVQQYTEYKTANNFMSINAHPTQDRHIMVSYQGYIYEVFNSEPPSYFRYNYSLMGVAVYSPNGNYVLSSNIFDYIMVVWDSNQKAVQQIRGWTCMISSISQNYGVVSVLDQCGTIGIIYNNQNSNFSAWFILIPIFILIIIASIISIQIVRKRRIAQQAIQGGYSNHSDQ